MFRSTISPTVVSARPWAAALLLTCCAGCLPSIEEQTKKSPNSIMGKKTQDIGEFNPQGGAAVSDSKVRVTNPVTGPLEAYGPMVEQISKTHVAHALNLYQAEHDHYPRDYDEFMREIIKKNNIQLPVLPGGKRYQYDVENHQLVVVDAAPAPGEAAPAPAAGDSTPDTASPATRVPGLPGIPGLPGAGSGGNP